mgnify:CR=1 FL=1
MVQENQVSEVEMEESWRGVWIYMSPNYDSAHVHRFLLRFIWKVDYCGKIEGIKCFDNRHVQPLLPCYTWKGACNGRGNVEYSWAKLRLVNIEVYACVIGTCSKVSIELHMKGRLQWKGNGIKHKDYKKETSVITMRKLNCNWKFTQLQSL